MRKLFVVLFVLTGLVFCGNVLAEGGKENIPPTAVVAVDGMENPSKLVRKINQRILCIVLLGESLENRSGVSYERKLFQMDVVLGRASYFYRYYYIGMEGSGKPRYKWLKEFYMFYEDLDLEVSKLESLI